MQQTGLCFQVTKVNEESECQRVHIVQCDLGQTALRQIICRPRHYSVLAATNSPLNICTPETVQYLHTRKLYNLLSTVRLN